MGAQAPRNSEVHFELQDDGTVVAGVRDYDAGSFADRQTMVWASPSDPTPHVIPVQASAQAFGSMADSSPCAGRTAATPR
jgi:hypothetical protein